MTLAEAVQKRVKRYGGYKETARRTRVTYSYVNRLAKGQAKNPSKETLHRLGIVELKEYMLV